MLPWGKPYCCWDHDRNQHKELKHFAGQSIGIFLVRKTRKHYVQKILPWWAHKNVQRSAKYRVPADMPLVSGLYCTSAGLGVQPLHGGGIGILDSLTRYYFSGPLKLHSPTLSHSTTFADPRSAQFQFPAPPAGQLDMRFGKP